jgi:hypothetical protein
MSRILGTIRGFKRECVPLHRASRHAWVDVTTDRKDIVKESSAILAISLVVLGTLQGSVLKQIGRLTCLLAALGIVPSLKVSCD